MREEFNKFEDTLGHVKSYINTRIAQAKLNVAEKTADLLSAFMARIMVGVVLFFFVLFLSQGLAVMLGSYWGKTWLGYLAVAGFYLLAGIFIWSARDKLLRIPIMNAIINRLFRENSNHHEKN